MATATDTTVSPAAIAAAQPGVHTHYLSASKGLIEIETMHSNHLEQTANKVEREGGDPSLVAHMRAVAARKVDEWERDKPEEYQAWAEKNPDKHAARLERKAAAGAVS